MAKKSSRRSSAREETSKWQKIVLWFHFLSSDRRQFFILQLQCHQFIPPKYQQSPLCLSKDSRERKKRVGLLFTLYQCILVRPSVCRLTETGTKRVYTRRVVFVWVNQMNCAIDIFQDVHSFTHHAAWIPFNFPVNLSNVRSLSIVLSHVNIVNTFNCPMEIVNHQFH